MSIPAAHKVGHVLLLGGTMEATALAHHLQARGVPATISFAGRVARPKRQALPMRVGGFGGVDGLLGYIKAQAITHVVDATHPFAAQMSHNAAQACAHAQVPLVALTRPAWTPQPGDQWRDVTSIEGAVAALTGPPHRVMLAIGRMHIDAFAAQPIHHYLLRLIDPPQNPVPLPHHDIVIDRGPFGFESDLALMKDRAITLVVSKNSGGDGAYGKIAAARALGCPVIMIQRPPQPNTRRLSAVDEVMAWLGHDATNLGV